MSDSTLPNSPYVGLTPYAEKDWPFFFGRERERRDIIASLIARRLTVLYGPSGVGKSSVLNAGVIHYLRQGAPPRRQAAAPLEVALAGGPAPPRPSPPEAPAPTKPKFAVVLFDKWDSEPLGALREAVFDELNIAPERRGEFPERLAEALKEASDEAGVVLLVILDQFEQYFVYHPYEAEIEVDDEEEPEDETGFADELARAVAHPALNVNFLISIRDDWWASLDRFKGRIPTLFDNYLRIGHLDDEAACKAIVGPVEEYNRRAREIHAGGQGHPPVVGYDPDFPWAVIEQLKQLDEEEGGELDFGVGRHPRGPRRARRIQTPYLQVVMSRFWEWAHEAAPPRLSAALFKDGPETAKRIVESLLDNLLKGFTPRQQEVAANLFRFLVPPSGPKIAYTSDDLAERTGRSHDQVTEVLDRLSGARVRILNRVAPPPNKDSVHRYEIAHDVLARPLLSWSRKIRSQLNERERAHRTRLKAVIGILTVVIFIGGAVLFAVRRERQLAKQAQREAVRQRNEAEQQREKAEAALRSFRTPDERIPHTKAVLRGHSQPITSAAFEPDGAAARVLTASADGSARLWDVASKESVSELHTNRSPLTCAAFNRDGRLIVTAARDGSIVLWPSDSPESLTLRGGGAAVTDVKFSPAADLLAAADESGAVIILNVAEGSHVTLPRGHVGAVKSLAFSRDGRMLASAGADGTARLWRVEDWNVRVLHGHVGEVRTVAFSHDGTRLVTAGADATARVWEAATGNAVNILRGHRAGVNAAAFDPEGRHVVTASADATARVWDWLSQQFVELNGHVDEVLSAAFSPDGKQVVTGSKDNDARVWSASTGSELAALRGHLGPVGVATFSPEGKLVLTASEDATARVWVAPQPGGFEVMQPVVSVEPDYYVGTCPATIKLWAKITAVGAGGTVSYRFIRSDGKIGETRQVELDGTKPKFVNELWKVGSSGSGWHYVEIIEPNRTQSPQGKFTIRCEEATGREQASPTPVPTPPAERPPEQ